MDIKLKPYKKDFSHSYVFGIYPTLELLASRPRDILKIIIAAPSAQTGSGLKKISSLCIAHHLSLEINPDLITKLSGSANTYAMGVFTKYTCSLNSEHNHLVLVNPTDMGNLGTIIRTMVGFNFTDLALISPAVDIFDPKVVRASMGSLFHLNFSYYPTFSAYQSAFPRSYYPLMTSASTDLAHTDFTSPFSLIFGSEGPGLSSEFSHLGTPLRISHSSAIDSLNLSVAVAITLYRTSLH